MASTNKIENIIYLHILYTQTNERRKFAKARMLKNINIIKYTSYIYKVDSIYINLSWVLPLFFSSLQSFPGTLHITSGIMSIKDLV